MRHTGVSLMLTVLAAVTVFSSKLTVQGTTDRNGVLYPSPTDSLLMCHQEIKLADGRTKLVAEDPPRLPYGRRVSQENNSRVFIPQDST